MKTFEMQHALDEKTIQRHFGAIVVEYLTFATGEDLIADAREVGLGGFHLVCKSSHLFQLLTELLNAGATVLGTGLVDRTVYGPEYETIATLKIGVNPAEAEERQEEA
jgi:hypothetical protein